MNKLSVLVTPETEQALLEWARERGERCTTADQAAMLVLDEFAKERKALLERIEDARRVLARKGF